MKINILGVRVDKINQTEALKLTESWIWNSGKHYIVTPNLEFILSAQEDRKFKEILNNADLAIPDSSSLGFSYWLSKRNILVRLLLWPFLLLPLKQLISFDTVSGTDFMDALCKLSAEKGFTTGFLGAGNEVAKKASECLQKKYPNLKVVFANSGGQIDNDGKMEGRENINIPPTDILFVALGHIKQEKWIANNLEKVPVHVAMGVGGAFDYFSGIVPRAPKIFRLLGFEWLFRLIVQPWRIKRQLSLLKYLWLLIRR